MPKNSPRAHHDEAWKSILDQYFRAFMEYCYPEVARQINWSRGYESLDKELSRIVPHGKLGTRIADKLFKVFQNDGTESWVLIHCEIQGNRCAQFAERMFIYRYRLFDYYRKPIASFAILADKNRNWRPQVYYQSLWGSFVKMGFTIVKLLDYQDRLDELRESTNPFSLLIQAHLATLHATDPKTLFTQKMALSRQLYEKNWDKPRITSLYAFIDWIITLPEDLALRYHEEISKIEEEKQVDYITTAERIGIQKGIKQGIEQGIERGIEQGIKRGLARGMLEGQRKILLGLLQHRFHHIPNVYRDYVHNADSAQLEAWSQRVLEARSLDGLFAAQAPA